ncbi:hypothetical protein AB0H42_18500 [Nocardia sp. NPDC050799]|uniref:hypothetical protein n=1 Tax=Nocardia sp. NPDC050799 TaxID=3154842 RepID=UPI0033F581A0
MWGAGAVPDLGDGFAAVALLRRGLLIETATHLVPALLVAWQRLDGALEAGGPARSC